jgi:hypothetical protein
VPEDVADGAMDEASQYHRRMKMLGTGSVVCDALSITAQLAMFSGSARDANASKAGLAALQRFHGMPHGAFAADPYLAGRDLSRASDLASVCALLEALVDLLCASGDTTYAERMERIVENALAGLIQPDGICESQSVNRFATDKTCAVRRAEPGEVSALLRALYAVRRAVWMVKGEADLAMLLPYEGCCLARMDGTPVRVCARRDGLHTLTLSIEAKQPAEFTLHLYVPGYAAGATVSLNGGRAMPAACGKLHAVKRLFRTGDTVTLALDCPPFVETGFRASASVYLGPLLMALPLPDADAAWQYAVSEDAEPSMFMDEGRPRVHIDACVASAWAARGDTITPPPQGVPLGDLYELTLLPYAETLGRIAAFPQAARRV